MTKPEVIHYKSRDFQIFSVENWFIIILTLLLVDKLLLGCVGTESEKLLVYIDLGKCMSIIHSLRRPAIEENSPILRSGFFFEKINL